MFSFPSKEKVTDQFRIGNICGHFLDDYDVEIVALCKWDTSTFDEADLDTMRQRCFGKHDIVFAIHYYPLHICHLKGQHPN